METDNITVIMDGRPSCALISYHSSSSLMANPRHISVASACSVKPLPFNDQLLFYTFNWTGSFFLSLSTTKRPHCFAFLSFESVWNSSAVEQRISPPTSRWIHRGLKQRRASLASLHSSLERGLMPSYEPSSLSSIVFAGSNNIYAHCNNKALFLVALLSTLVLSFVLLCVAWIVSSSIFRRTPYRDLSREEFFFRSRLGQYATCLLLSNWVRAVSGTIDINWIRGGGAKAGEKNSIKARLMGD